MACQARRHPCPERHPGRNRTFLRRIILARHGRVDLERAYRRGGARPSARCSMRVFLTCDQSPGRSMVPRAVMTVLSKRCLHSKPRTDADVALSASRTGLCWTMLTTLAELKGARGTDAMSLEGEFALGDAPEHGPQLRGLVGADFSLEDRLSPLR